MMTESIFMIHKYIPPLSSLIKNPIHFHTFSRSHIKHENNNFDLAHVFEIYIRNKRTHLTKKEKRVISRPMHIFSFDRELFPPQQEILNFHNNTVW